MKIFRIFIPALLLGLSLCVQAWASGLKMNYAEVLVKNLRIGGNYNLTELVNMPLEVTSHSEEPIEIELSVLKPAAATVKKGFESVPDASWVKLGRDKLDIGPNGTAKTDVMISIPNDERYLGRQYHANILARMKPTGKGMVVTLAVQGRLLFSVAPVKEAPDQTGAVKTNLDFSIEPGRVEMKDVPLGKKTAVLINQKELVRVENPNSVGIEISLESLNPKDTVLSVRQGYEATPDPSRLTFANTQFTLNGRGRKDIQMTLDIPDDPAWRGKRYEFIVAISTGGEVSGTRYLPVLVSTAKEKE